jgi:hypothetical protein
MEILQLLWSRHCPPVNTLQLYCQLNYRAIFSQPPLQNSTDSLSSQSQSYIATDGQSVSMSWCRAQSGAHDQIFITVWQLRSCFCGAPSLTRGRVCLLYMLLGLPNAVFLGSESLGTRDHILLSQIWDFPFRRLLRLAGSRWRYSTPSPHGLLTPWFIAPTLLVITSRHGPHRKHRSSKVRSCPLQCERVYSAVAQKRVA